MKNKSYSALSVVGISIATLCFLLIISLVRFEKSYDSFNINKDRTYRVIKQNDEDKSKIFARSPGLLADLLKENFSEVEEAARFGIREVFIQHQTGKIKEKRFAYADPSLFKVFTFNMLVGDYSALDDKANAILISETTAKKYFGTENPIGKTILLDNNTIYDVTGVFKDIPANSHIKFDFAVSFKNYIKNPTWNQWNYFTYIRLVEGKTIEQLKAATLLWTQKTPDQIDVFKEIDYQNIGDIHFQFIRGNLEPVIDRRLLLSSSIVAFFILLIACINFMNMSIVSTYERSKEISIKKIFGIKHFDSILIILKETLTLSIVGILFGTVAAKVALPYFNQFTGRQIEISVFDNLLIISGGVVLLSCFLSGLYPAYLFSKFNPINLIRKSAIGKKAGLINAMIFIQVVVSITLLCSTLLIKKQMQFLEKYKKGFESEHVINVKLQDDISYKKRVEIKNEILKIPSILSASINDCDFASTNINHLTGINWMGAKTNVEERTQQGIWMIFADKDFIKTMGIEITQGRELIESDNSSSELGIIFNNAALTAMDDKQIGRVVDLGAQKLKTIGFVNDFNFRSLHYSVEPASIVLSNRGNQLSIRIIPGDINEPIHQIEKVIKIFSPDYPFTYAFLDQEMNNYYQSEQKTFSIMIISSLISILLSCLGILGIISYSTKKRIKEIGIRKVNGSKIWEIMLLLSQNIIRLFIAAFFVAVPLAYYFINNWIKGFAYKTNLSWWVFALAGLLALCVALLTVSWQSWRAATRNPVEALRYE